MKNYKSPDPYGFHPLFFENQWDIVGKSIHKMVVNCFNDPSKIEDINKNPYYLNS